MDLRSGLAQIATVHRLDAAATWLPRGVADLAAALGGLGVVFWIAANWQMFGRFTLLDGFILATCAGPLGKPAARALALNLKAVRATGVDLIRQADEVIR